LLSIFGFFTMRITMKYFNLTKLFLITSTLALLASLLLQQFFKFDTANSLIFVHVVLGSLACVIGGVTLLSKKGSPLHKRSGTIFYVAMVVSVSITLVVSLTPNHFSLTLFHIGVLSLYFLIGGKRSIAFKLPTHKLLIDRLLAYIIVAVSLVIMSYTIVLHGSIHPLRTVFGIIGMGFGLFDLWLFKKPESIHTKWLLLHLSKMLGGYTAAVTAFFVAQNILSGYFNWFLPTAVGLSYIFFWMFKLQTFRVFGNR
jgi:uncharacterized membrane protein